MHFFILLRKFQICILRNTHKTFFDAFVLKLQEMNISTICYDNCYSISLEVINIYHCVFYNHITHPYITISNIRHIELIFLVENMHFFILLRKLHICILRNKIFFYAFVLKLQEIYISNICYDNTYRYSFRNILLHHKVFPR